MFFPIPRVLLATLAMAASLAGLGVAPAAALPDVSRTTAEAKDRYLVRFAPGLDATEQSRSLKARGLAVGRTFRHVQATVLAATPAQAQALARSPHIVTVEKDQPVSLTATQDAASWGLDRIDQRALPLSSTFSPAASGAGVNVYVVDTGVRGSHVEFTGRIQPGWTAIADGHGTADCNGHGTHVAGTAAGAAYGVARSAKIIPVRVLGCAGSGHMSDVIAGLDWIVAHHPAGVPAVANLSVGGGASAAVDSAVQAVINDGVTAVVAAGNSGVDACSSSPARVPAAVTVAATTSADKQAGFSNFGQCVDTYAPGVSITSASHSSATASSLMSGTSMAAPHVAGAAALLLSRDATLTPSRVAATLAGNATTGRVSGAGAGTPNRLLYVEPLASAPAATAPSRPRNVKAAAGRTSARVTWTKGSSGGSALTRQVVTVISGGKRVGRVALPPSISAAKITGLKANKAYVFRVAAKNRIGASPLSPKSNRVVAQR